MYTPHNRRAYRYTDPAGPGLRRGACELRRRPELPPKSRGLLGQVSGDGRRDAAHEQACELLRGHWPRTSFIASSNPLRPASPGRTEPAPVWWTANDAIASGGPHVQEEKSAHGGVQTRSSAADA